MHHGFRRRGDALLLALEPPEVALLRRLPEELAPVLAAAPNADDPVAKRLYPRAYLDPTEEAAESDWQTNVHPELVRQKAEALATLAETLDRARSGRRDRLEVRLSGDEGQAWLGALNDARLALGVALAVTEEMEDADLAPDDPRTPALAYYRWLTWLQADLIEALTG